VEGRGSARISMGLVDCLHIFSIRPDYLPIDDAYGSDFI